MTTSAPRIGHRIHVTRKGTGPPLLLIHPLGADHQVWRPVLGRLTGRREVITVDLPGFGATPPLDGAAPPTPARLALAVADALDELAIDGCAVAGNSLGGWVALELALLGRASSVTVIAPAGLWPRPLAPKPGLGRRAAAALRPALGPLTRSRRARRIALMAVVAHPDRVPREDALALLRAYAGARGLTAVNAAMRAGRFNGLDRIDVPLTFGWPDHDRLVARPARLPAASRSVVLHDCGHIPMWDDPQQVADLLLDGSAAESDPPHPGPRRAGEGSGSLE